MRNIALFIGIFTLALAAGYVAISVQAQDKQASPVEASASATAPAAENTTATANSAQNLTIAVVDIEKILSSSKAAKSIKAEVDEKRKGFISEVEKAEKELRDSQKAIEKESKKISKEELVKKAQEFEKKRLTARKDIQAKKSKLDKAYTEAMNSLTKNIYDVCQKIADARKIDLVITRQNIIVGNMALDITSDVLKDLDAALPKLDLKVK